MKHLFQKKKFLLNQPIQKLDPKVELLGLKTLLEIVLKDENYEIAIIIRNRIKKLEMMEHKTGHHL